MPSPIKLSMFCQNAGHSSGIPGKPNYQITLTLPPKSDRIDDENKDVFADAQNRSATINLQNVSPEMAAQFAKAPRVKVTIEIEE